MVLGNSVSLVRHARLVLFGLGVGAILLIVLWLTKDHTLIHVIAAIGGLFGYSPGIEGEARTSAVFDTLAFGVAPICAVVGIAFSYMVAGRRRTRRSR